VPCVFLPGLKIELKAEDLYDKEKVDLETIVIEDVFKLLQSTDQGLTSEEAAHRLDLFGPNKLESEEQNPILQVCRIFQVHHIVALRLISC
jgi:H+-transporting ATPase